MGNPISGAYPVPGDLGQQLAEMKAAIAQLQRLMTREQKIPPPAAAGGGVVGQAEVWAQQSTVLWAAGSSLMDYTAVRYQAPSSVGPETVAPSWLTVSDHQILLDPGWYIPVMHVRFGWDSEAASPLGFTPYMGGGNDTPHGDFTVYPRAKWASTKWGIYAYVNYGPTYIREGQGDHLHVEVRAQDATTVSTAATSKNIGWTVTKLS